MAIIYQQGANDDLAPLASVGFDDQSNGWWGGTQKCFASIALAAVLAATAVSTAIASQVSSQDQSEVVVAQFAHDDYWQNPSAPVAASNYQKLQFVDLDEIPAGSLYGQPDEDFWVNPVAPVPAAIYQRLPLGDPEEIPAGSLRGQLDEDFWQNPVAPVAASLYQKLPLGDVEEIPAGRLFGQYDEDLWLSGVAPLQAVNIWPQPWTFDTQDAFPAPFFPDEDYWQNQVPPVSASIYRSPLFSDIDDVPAGNLHGGIDEDFWVNPVPPVTASTYQRLPFTDVEELPGNLHGQFDEDFWFNPVAPVWQSFFRSPIFLEPEHLTPQQVTSFLIALSGSVVALLISQDGGTVSNLEVATQAGGKPLAKLGGGIVSNLICLDGGVFYPWS